MAFFSAALPAIGAGLSYLQSRNAGKRAQGNFEAQMAMAREFAQNGIRWKVEDAKAAGIHPLFALGGNTATYSPGAIPAANPGVDFAQLGQNIGSSIDNTRTASERHSARLQELQLERAELENAQIRSQIALNNANRTPPMPEPVMAAGVNRYTPIVTESLDDVIPSHDEHGNRIHSLSNYFSGDDWTYQVLPRGMHPAENAEQLFGEIGSIPAQLKAAEASGMEFINREDLVRSVMELLFGTPGYWTGERTPSPRANTSR